MAPKPSSIHHHTHSDSATTPSSLSLSPARRPSSSSSCSFLPSLSLTSPLESLGGLDRSVSDFSCSLSSKQLLGQEEDGEKEEEEEKEKASLILDTFSRGRRSRLPLQQQQQYHQRRCPLSSFFSPLHLHSPSPRLSHCCDWRPTDSEGSVPPYTPYECLQEKDDQSPQHFKSEEGEEKQHHDKIMDTHLKKERKRERSSSSSSPSRYNPERTSPPSLPSSSIDFPSATPKDGPLPSSFSSLSSPNLSHVCDPTCSSSSSLSHAYYPQHQFVYQSHHSHPSPLSPSSSLSSLPPLHLPSYRHQETLVYTAIPPSSSASLLPARRPSSSLSLSSSLSRSKSSWMTFLIPRASLSLSIPVLLLVGFSPFFCMLVFILGLHNVLLAMLIMHWVCMTTVPLVYIYLFEHSFQYYRHVWAIQRCRFRKQWIWGIAFCLITLGFLYLVYYLCAFPYNIFGSNYHWRWFERLLDKIHRNCLQRGLDLSFPLLVLSGLYFFLINPLIEEWFWRVFLYREFGGAVFVAVPNGVLHMKESNPLMISCCMHASHSTVAIPIGEPEEGGEEGREEKETEDKQERERHKEKEEEKRGDSSSSSSLTHPTSATLHDVTEAILRQGSSHAELSSINPIDSSSSSLPVGLPPPSTSPLSHSIPPVVASSHFKTGVKSEEAHPLPSSRSPVGLSPHLNEEKKHERNLFPSRDNEENDEERLPYLSPTSEAPQAFSMQSPHHPPYPPPPLGSSSPTEYFYSLSSPTHDHPAHEVPASSQGERETDENNKKKRPLHGQDSKETEGESRNPLATYTATTTTTSPNAPKTKSTDDGEEGETTVIKMRLPGIGSSPSSFICEEGDEGEGKNEEDDRLRDFSPSCDFAGVLIEKDEKKTSAGNGKKLTEHGEALEEDEEDSCASESPALPSPSAPVITRVGPGILQVDVELSLLGKALLSFFYASYHAVVFATLIDLIYGFLALPIITLLGMILIYLRNTTRFGILSGVLLHVGVDAAVVAVLGSILGYY